MPDITTLNRIAEILGVDLNYFSSNLVPPIALLTAWLWLGETLTLQQGIGTLLALGGVILARRFTAPVENKVTR
jgi:drug/metabolite transporter (DMT)-like permease